MKFLRLIAIACCGSLIFLLLNASLPMGKAPACPSSSPCFDAPPPPTVSSPARLDSLLPTPEAARAGSPMIASEPQSGSPADEAVVDPQGPLSVLPDFLQNQSPVVLGILASLMAGLATGVGAIPVLFTTKISDRLQGSLLGFAAGVMLAATSFSLLIPSIERVVAGGGSDFYAAGVAVGGTLIGSGFIWFADRKLPYDRFISTSRDIDYDRLKGIWLFILAIAVHNFPEGLAVGVGFGGGNVGNGLALAIGIGLQNLPEGLAVALALVTHKYSKWPAFWIAVATGLVEPVGGLLGVGIISLGEALLPWGLAFAAGAMLFVIGDEVIPEAQNLEKERVATAAIVVGFVIMMFLDVSLG